MIPIVEKPLSSEAEILQLEASGDWASTFPANSIYELLSSVESRYGHQFALTFLPTGSVDDTAQRYTYREFMNSVRRAANLFTSLGVGRDDVVSILAPNLPETVFALWGATTVGIANPINFLLNDEQLEALLFAANTKVLVALGPNPKLDVWGKVDKIRHRLPALKTVLQMGGEPEDGVLSFERCLQEQPEDRLLANCLPQRRDRALYFHTGGTTGTPKLAARCHENEMYCAWAASQMWHFTPDDVVINVLPFFHVAGAIVSGLGPLISGAEVLLPSPFGLRHPTALADIWKTSEKYGATHLGGVPTNLVAMLALSREGLDLYKLRYTLTGGAALPVQLGKSWREIVGKPLTQIYGMTEAGSTIAGSPVLADPVDGAIGIRFPYGSWHIVSVDHPEGPSLAPYRQGVVVVKSPGTFLGYLDEKQNQGVLLADGSVVTGDLGYSDEQGNLFLCGRSKDLIIRGGHNIDPSVIEEALCYHEDVAFATAVGRPDIYAGEVPVAYVQLKSGAQRCGEDLLAWVSGCISEAPALPKEIMIIDNMPMTAVGKIFKPALRYLELERAAREALESADGVAGLRVLAREDSLLGLLVEVFLPADQNNARLREKIAQCLGRFSFNFTITCLE